MDTVKKSKHIPPTKRGSRKGVPNRNTQQLKDMILEALYGVGGVEYLQDCALDPKTANSFLSLIGKVLPITVAGDKDNPVKLILEWTPPVKRL